MTNQSVLSDLGDRGVPPELLESCNSRVSPERRPILIDSLEASDRFRRDTGVGRIFHWGKISYREMSDVDSLHILIDGDQVSVHLDEISPLRRKPDGTVGYSLSRIMAHNLSGMVADVSRRLRGQHGQQRCNLSCDVVWVDEEDH